jgi:hypothetical protein
MLEYADVGSTTCGYIMEHRPDSLDLLERVDPEGGSKGGADHNPTGGTAATGLSPHSKMVFVADLPGL